MFRQKTSKHPQLIQIDDFSPFSESFRVLKINIHFSANKQKIQSIAITSATKGEGKTTTAMQLAKSYADAGKSVVAIDTNLRKVEEATVFSKVKLGLADYLYDSSLQATDIITKINNFSYIPSGMMTFNSADLLVSERMDELISELKNEFDMIIVDTPALLQLVDAKVMSAKCDGVLVVVKQGSLKKSDAKKANDELRKVKANVLGIVINKV